MNNIVISSSAVDRWKETKIIFWRKCFLHWILFSSKKSWLFWYDSSMGYTEEILKTKVTVLKFCFFEKKRFSKQHFWNGKYISAGKEGWCWKSKITFQVIFFGIEQYFHEKRILIGWQKLLRGVYRKDDKTLFLGWKNF